MCGCQVCDIAPHILLIPFSTCIRSPIYAFKFVKEIKLPLNNVHIRIISTQSTIQKFVFITSLGHDEVLVLMNSKIAIVVIST